DSLARSVPTAETVSLKDTRSARAASTPTGARVPPAPVVAGARLAGGPSCGAPDGGVAAPAVAISSAGVAERCTPQAHQPRPATPAIATRYVISRFIVPAFDKTLAQPSAGQGRHRRPGTPRFASASARSFSGCPA